MCRLTIDEWRYVGARSVGMEGLREGGYGMLLAGCTPTLRALEGLPCQLIVSGAGRD